MNQYWSVMKLYTRPYYNSMSILFFTFRTKQSIFHEILKLHGYRRIDYVWVKTLETNMLRYTGSFRFPAATKYGKLLFPCFFSVVENKFPAKIMCHT